VTAAVKDQEIASPGNHRRVQGLREELERFKIKSSNADADLKMTMLLHDTHKQLLHLRSDTHGAEAYYTNQMDKMRGEIKKEAEFYEKHALDTAWSPSKVDH